MPRVVLDFGHRHAGGETPRARLLVQPLATQASSIPWRPGMERVAEDKAILDQN